VKTLIIVPTLGLKEQLKESLLTWFGSLDNIHVENIDSVNLKRASDYDLVICDECHHGAAKTYRTLNRKNWTKIYYRVFLTATPYRSNEDEQLLMESLCGPVVYRIPHKLAVEKKFIVPIEAYYYDLPKIKCDAYTWAEVYSSLVVKRKDRNQLIADLLDNLMEAGKSAICLVKEIAHGDLIRAEMKHPCPFIKGEETGKHTLIQEFNKQENLILIGTEGCLGEGIDTKACEYVIIAGLGKSRPRLLQQCGRSVRRYPGKESAKVIIFRDFSHKFTARHFREQVKTIRDEYGVDVVKIV
jgi:superfamily II DNA or RNA helicase